jgi:hypothetical protein
VGLFAHDLNSLQRSLVLRQIEPDVKLARGRGLARRSDA